MKLHVVHLTSVHRADDVRIFQKECLSLVRSGYEVTIVAPRSPGLADGAGVRRVFVATRSGRLSRVVRTTFDILVAAMRLGGDLYHIHDPELLPIGMILRLCGYQVIYDAHEDVRKQNLHKEWIARPLRRAFAIAIDCVERAIGRNLSGIVAATDQIGRKFSNHQVALVRNFPMQSAALHDAKTAIESARIVYAGGMSEARGLLSLVEAVNLVQHDCTLTCAGNVDAKFAKAIREMDVLGRTKLMGWLSAEEILCLYRSSAIGAVTLLPTPAHVESLPLKLFEYMAAGLPVIASEMPSIRYWEIPRRHGQWATGGVWQFWRISTGRAKSLGCWISTGRSSIKEPDPLQPGASGLTSALGPNIP